MSPPSPSAPVTGPCIIEFSIVKWSSIIYPRLAALMTAIALLISSSDYAKAD